MNDYQPAAGDTVRLTDARGMTTDHHDWTVIEIRRGLVRMQREHCADHGNDGTVTSADPANVRPIRWYDSANLDEDDLFLIEGLARSTSVNYSHAWRAFTARVDTSNLLTALSWDGDRVARLAVENELAKGLRDHGPRWAKAQARRHLSDYGVTGNGPMEQAVRSAQRAGARAFLSSTAHLIAPDNPEMIEWLRGV